MRAKTILSAVLVLIAIGVATSARAGQLGLLISPGPLSRAHAALEGARNCVQCHEAGRKVTASRCLTCHQPIAERITLKIGAHRSVKDDCISCHSEHAGVDADLRRFDTRTFNHTADTRFPLTGRHAQAQPCAACHKTRSFLQARTDCASCHADPHKGSLGAVCTTCHSVDVAFTTSGASFNHSAARFQLTGAHREVACAQCHKDARFRGVAFASCTSCHTDPHQKKQGATCTNCHTTARWTTRTIDHAKTDFPLRGAHADVACARCHKTDELTKPVAFGKCSSCHANVHGRSISEDCGSCHTERSFRGAPFDHEHRTSFALTGKHEGLECRACHTGVSGSDVPVASKSVDYSGASSACVSCHSRTDPHKGEFGQRCEACHGTATFSVKTFRHAKESDFYEGSHANVGCERCHAPGKRLEPIASTRAATAALVEAARPSMVCATCHTDVHLGQFAQACDSCHAVAGARFKAINFAHDRTAFPLTGKHADVECAACHRPETRAFPARTGQAVRFKPVGAECRTCHDDVHLGQVDARCDSCHDTATFKMTAYTHHGLDDFFAGFHRKYACVDCHKRETGQFPGGRGTAIRFSVGRTCAACHPQF